MTLAQPGQVLPHLDLNMFSYDDIRSMCPSASISPGHLIAGFLQGAIYSNISAHAIPASLLKLLLQGFPSVSVLLAMQSHRIRTRRDSGDHLIKLPYFTGSKPGPDKLRSKVTQLGSGRQGALGSWLSNSRLKILFS